MSVREKERAKPQQAAGRVQLNFCYHLNASLRQASGIKRGYPSSFCPGNTVWRILVSLGHNACNSYGDEPEVIDASCHLRCWGGPGGGRRCPMLPAALLHAACRRPAPWHCRPRGTIPRQLVSRRCGRTAGSRGRSAIPVTPRCLDV